MPKLKNEPKKLADFKYEQMNLPFILAEPEPSYSNTIELYDAIPKYFWGRIASKDRKGGQYLDSIKREFKFRKDLYNIKITPARLEDKNGVEIDYFPGEKESLVEDALRKLACDGKGLFLNSKAGVVFTLSELQRELKRVGHSYSLQQIKHSIQVCQGTRLHLESHGGKINDMSYIFPRSGFNEESWKGKGKQTVCYVIFNELVTASIKQNTYRMTNYETYMSLNSSMGRYLHKRMSHLFKQASWDEPFTIHLLTILRDDGRTIYKELRNNLREACKTLDEMADKNVILKYKTNKILNGRKLFDVKFTLFPHRTFTRDIKKANHFDNKKLTG